MLSCSLEDAKIEIDGLKARQAELEDELIRTSESLQGQIRTEQAAQIDLLDNIQHLNMQLAACNERCEQVLAMHQAQAQEQRDEAREYLTQALRVLED